MENNDLLFNAAMIGENHEASFVLDGVKKNRLHAVDKTIADQRSDSSNPKLLIPCFRDALKALIKLASGKVESHFLEVDWKLIQGKPDEQQQITHIIHNIYTHLPHHDRNELSTLIHHKQNSKQK